MLPGNPLRELLLMGMTQWIPSDWLTPLPYHRTDSSPFYPWPEDWLTRRTMLWI